MSTADFLQVEKIEKSYASVRAVSGLSFRVGRGEVFGLLGPNGAGKTTTVSIVCGLVRPEAGEVRVGGIDVRRAPRRAQRQIGFAPQETGVHLALSTRENLVYFGRLAGLRGPLLGRRVRHAIERFGLAALADRAVHALSSGQRRRIHVASAILHRPPLVILDEPTAFLDPEGRRAVLDAVRELASEGCVVIYSTHILSEAEEVCDRALVVGGGVELACDSIERLIDRFGETQVALTFQGDAETGALERAGLDVSRVSADRVVVRTDRGASHALLLRTITGLGDAAARLASVELVRPSLQSVFFALTGRGVDGDGPDAKG